MKSIKFSQLPGIVHFSIGVSIFMVWHLFEVFIINKYLYMYLPGYVVGDPCIWDTGVALVITAGILLCRKNYCLFKSCNPVNSQERTT